MEAWEIWTAFPQWEYYGGTTSKSGYEYLDDQLGSLKDKIKINQYQLTTLL